jgi:hypothetical protein
MALPITMPLEIGFFYLNQTTSTPMPKHPTVPGAVIDSVSAIVALNPVPA